MPDKQTSDKRRYVVLEAPNGDRTIMSKGFNMGFRKADGLTVKWGASLGEDPTHCPFGNEIADIEITTSCQGIHGTDGKRQPCGWCYKSLGPKGRHMPLGTFKQVFDNLNKARTMTQIALGADAGGLANPDTLAIMDYAILHGVTPNITVADITSAAAEALAKRCGAVAVSCYPHNKHACYNSVELLADARGRLGRGMAVNMHVLLARETLPLIEEVLADIKDDPRLAGLQAVVFLSLKRRGRGVSLNQVGKAEFTALMGRLLDGGVPFGMDSCSATAFLDVLDNREEGARLKPLVEPCEAFCFSAYVNVEGRMFPCSFMEGEAGWEEGIDLANPLDFQEVWRNDPRVAEWRARALENIRGKGCNSCPAFEIIKED